jgi:predicted TIM-barrel fold metal-dependent hydrolase
LIIDTHCHLALTRRKADDSIERFSFEPQGARAFSGYDSYLSDRMLGSILWRFLRWKLGIDGRLKPGEEMDAAIIKMNERHLLDAPSVDRFVLLAFDEYHTADGEAVGPSRPGGGNGSDMYSSNSFVRHFCRQHPEKLLFCASIHPYRSGALEALEEVNEAGAVMIKWLPVHQNIDARDERVAAFMRRAGELNLPMLIHYGSEMALRRNHRDQMNPAPMLELLGRLKGEGRLPTVIIAHVAAWAVPWSVGPHARRVIDALLHQFADDPVYADISALTNKPGAITHIRRRPELHDKLVYASDFPIPPGLWGFPWLWPKSGRIKASPSWPEQTYRLIQALGFDESIFKRGYDILRHRIESPTRP